MKDLIVPGVTEKDIKTILETSHSLCDGLKGEYRTMGRKVFAVLFGTKVEDPTKNHVLQALKAAKKCELIIDGKKVQTQKVKMATYSKVEGDEIEIESAEWEPIKSCLKLEAVTL